MNLLYASNPGEFFKNGTDTVRCKTFLITIDEQRRLPGGVIDRLREGRPVTTETLDTVCRLCECQPGDLLEWVPDSPEK